jgi:hypothetical protein
LPTFLAAAALLLLLLLYGARIVDCDTDGDPPPPPPLPCIDAVFAAELDGEDDWEKEVALAGPEGGEAASCCAAAAAAAPAVLMYPALPPVIPAAAPAAAELEGALLLLLLLLLGATMIWAWAPPAPSCGAAPAAEILGGSVGRSGAHCAAPCSMLAYLPRLALEGEERSDMSGRWWLRLKGEES